MTFSLFSYFCLFRLHIFFLVPSFLCNFDLIFLLFIVPAVRIAPSLLEIRKLECLEAAGRSPTRELLWSWAQQNSTVQDLLNVLQDMGHHRALQLFQAQAKGQYQNDHFHFLHARVTMR